MVVRARINEVNAEKLLRGEPVRIRLRPGTTYIDVILEEPPKGAIDKLLDAIFGRKK